MIHLIVDRRRGIIFISSEPPSPIDVHFDEVPPLEPVKTPEEPPVLTQKPFAYREYPVPDEKLLKKGFYVTTSIAAPILGVPTHQMQHLAAQKLIKAYRKEGTALLLFLLDDVVTYIKNKNK